MRKSFLYIMNVFFILFLFVLSTAFIACHYKAIPASNGVLRESLKDHTIHQADPTIFYYKGMYYLYGTNDGNVNNGFIVYSSKDMKNWKKRGPVLIKGDAFGDRGFWAPQVWQYKGKMYMAYTANERIAIASSDSPLGPFKQAIKEPLASAFSQIDPYVFIDDDDKKYLFHVRLDKGNHIYVAEMSDDFSRLKPDTYHHCITATSRTWEQVDSASVKIAEGPAVIKRHGLYYLFYSANDFRSKDYAVGYAVSKSIYGPWTRYTGNPVIHRTITGQAGSGHGDLIKGKDNELYYVFHTHQSNTEVHPRKTAMIRLKIIKDSSGNDAFVADPASFRYLTYSTK